MSNDLQKAKILRLNSVTVTIFCQKVEGVTTLLVLIRPPIRFAVQNLRIRRPQFAYVTLEGSVLLVSMVFLRRMGHI